MSAPVTPVTSGIGAMVTDGSFTVEVVAAPPVTGSRRMIMKVLLDMSPIFISLGMGYGFCTLHSAWIYGVMSATIIASFCALIVDRVTYKKLRTAGLEAVWPKMITLTFFVMNFLILVLYSVNAVSAHWISIWCGCGTSGSLFLAAALGTLLDKSFIYAVAVELLPPEKLRFFRENNAPNNVFLMILATVTKVWTYVFLALFLVSIAAAIIRTMGYHATSAMVGIVGAILVIYVGAGVITPKAVEATKERGMARHVEPFV